MQYCLASASYQTSGRFWQRYVLALTQCYSLSGSNNFPQKKLPERKIKRLVKEAKTIIWRKSWSAP